MVVFPNCKINLGLQILEKRSDGYHNLETVFYPLPLQDALEVIHEDTKEKNLQFSVSGTDAEALVENNSCTKAYQLLKQDFPELPPVFLHLHKVIPMGAGLGGGSADGAFTLALLNKKFQLGLTEEQLLKYAAQLGSDCPFFIKNDPCYATGRGEMLEALALNLNNYKFLIVNPNLQIATAWAFAQIKPLMGRTPVKEIISLPITEWKGKLINDFEKVVFPAYPVLEHIKTTLYEAGAVYASMSGSGATVFGIFEKEQIVAVSFPPHYFRKEC